MATRRVLCFNELKKTTGNTHCALYDSLTAVLVTERATSARSINELTISVEQLTKQIESLTADITHLNADKRANQLIKKTKIIRFGEKAERYVLP